MTKLARGTHPTVHEVLTGDRRLPVERGDAPGGLLVRIGRRMGLPLHRYDARRELLRAFGPRDPGYPASTTLVGMTIDDGVRTLRMLDATGHESAIMLPLRQ